MPKRIAVAFVLGIATLIPRAQAAEVTVRLEISPASTTPGQAVQATVTVTGAIRGLRVDLPGSADVQVRSAGTSRNVQIINGDVQSSYQYFYRVMARQPGSYELGPARVEQGSNVFTSNTATLTVAPAQAMPAAQSGVFVEADVEPTHPYVGQQVTYTFRLFRPQSRQYGNFEFVPPTTNGLWQEELDTRSDRATVLNGKRYAVHTIQKAFFPTREGTVEIGPAAVTYHEALPKRRRAPRGIFDDSLFDMFGARTVQRRTETSPITLDIAALPPPPAGVDAATAAVGVFTLSATLSDDRIRLGESITMTLRIEGRGNVRTLPDVMLPESADYKVYPDLAQIELDTQSPEIRGVRQQRIAIVPQREGSLTIPSVTLPAFNPETGAWSVLRTAPVTLQVAPGESQTPVVIAQVDGVDPRAQVRATRLASGLLAPHPLPEDLRFASPRDRVLGTVAVVLPPLCFLVSWLVRRRAAGHAADPTWRRRRLAGRTARAALRTSPSPTPETVSGVLTAYIADRLGAPAGAITGEEGVSIIARCVPALAGDAARVIRAGEAARYGGPAETLDASVESGLKLLVDLERVELRQGKPHA